MTVTITQIAQLRKETGLGLGKVRGALLETEGDFDAAKQLLRERNKEFVQIGDTNEGTIACYMHHNSQVGAMVELGCVTDFNAKSDEFVKLANDIAIHIAGANPSAVSLDDLDPKLLETELTRVMALNPGKPENVIERIKQGVIKKVGIQHCLLNQPFVKDESTTVGEMLNEISAKTGEKVVVKRFSRFAVSNLADLDLTPIPVPE